MFIAHVGRDEEVLESIAKQAAEQGVQKGSAETTTAGMRPDCREHATGMQLHRSRLGEAAVDRTRGS